MLHRLTQAPGYRSDIDGLRAIAVLCVLGYHGFPNFLPGGFVGVDIFFVISGFLISRIIFVAVDDRTFSYAEFYGRRVRRIFPALAIVLCACLALGVAYLLPGALAQLGLHVAAGASFLSNVLLWTQAGYFDGASSTKPLLHLWSLGIEEQYYLLWPVLIAAVGAKLRHRLLVIICVGTSSLALNLAIAIPYPVSDFYLPFTRFWELLGGASLAFGNLYNSRNAQFSPRILHITSILGVIFIGISLALVREGAAFPGWRALLPTIGALLLIASGSRALVNRYILSSRVAVFFGLISYPLYLWHWPVLVMPKLIGIVFPGFRFVALLSSIILAWITYAFVEVPIRTLNRRRITTALLYSLAAIAIAGMLLYWSKGLPQRYPDALRNVAVAAQDFHYEAYREGTCFLGPQDGPDVFADTCLEARHQIDAPLVLLWGDSHAASLSPGLRALAAESQLSVAQYTASACPPVVGFVVSTRPHCKDVNDYVLSVIRRSKPTTVIMLASWSFYSGQAFERLDSLQVNATIQLLRDAGVRQVLLVGPLPRWEGQQPDLVLQHWNQTHQISFRSFAHFDNAVYRYDQTLELATKDGLATYVSPIQSLCNEFGCPAVIKMGSELYPVAWDDAHLTVEGSQYVVRHLFKQYLK